MDVGARGAGAVQGPVIGLTGSAGKTSTKEFLAAYPAAYASPSSFNNFWGVPLTLCNASPAASVWVVEMGMNQTGEIARLSELTKPPSRWSSTCSRCIWKSSAAWKRSGARR